MDLVEEALLPKSSLEDQNSDSDSEIDQTYIPKKRNYVAFFFRFIVKAFVVILALGGMFSLGTQAVQRYKSRTPVSCSCGGSTVAEAISRGCEFTPLALAWLPPQCLDKELADEFDKTGPLPGGEWPYWADANGTIPITREQMGHLAEVKGVFYTIHGWHVAHCMYTWRKHYRSRFNNIALEWRNDGMDHIEHCTGIVTDRTPLDKIWVMAGVELNADLG